MDFHVADWSKESLATLLVLLGFFTLLAKIAAGIGSRGR